MTNPTPELAADGNGNRPFRMASVGVTPPRCWPALPYELARPVRKNLPTLLAFLSQFGIMRGSRGRVTVAVDFSSDKEEQDAKTKQGVSSS